MHTDYLYHSVVLLFTIKTSIIPGEKYTITIKNEFQAEFAVIPQRMDCYVSMKQFTQEQMQNEDFFEEERVLREAVTNTEKMSNEEKIDIINKYNTYSGAKPGFSTSQYYGTCPVVGVGNQENYVIAVPCTIDGSYNGYFFRQYEKYYLTNFTNLASLYNYDHPNPMNEDYVLQDDNGAFFISTDFEYDASVISSGSTNFNDTLSIYANMFGLSLDYASSLLGNTDNILGSIIKIASNTIGIFDTINSTIETLNKHQEYQEYLSYHVSSNSKKITTKYFPNTSTAQKEEHRCLYKDAFIQIQDIKNRTLYMDRGDTISFQYGINPGVDSNTPKIPYNVWIGHMLSLSVTSIEQENGTSSDLIFGEPIVGYGFFSEDIPELNSNTTFTTSELKANEKNSVYILPGKGYTAKFIPQSTGEYRFTSPNPYARIQIKNSYNGSIIVESMLVNGQAVIDGITLTKDSEYYVYYDMFGQEKQIDSMSDPKAKSAAKRLMKSRQGCFDLNVISLQSEDPTIVALDKTGGDGGPDQINVIINHPLPSEIAAPIKEGYTFMGYYTQPNGKGTQYYNSSMQCMQNWNEENVSVLYAHWQAKIYTVTLDYEGGHSFATGSFSFTGTVFVRYGEYLEVNSLPLRSGYDFRGYKSSNNIPYLSAITLSVGSGQDQYYTILTQNTIPWDIPENTTLYAMWEPLHMDDYRYEIGCNSTRLGASDPYSVTNGETYRFVADPMIDDYKFLYWEDRNGGHIRSNAIDYTVYLKRDGVRNLIVPADYLYAIYEAPSGECIAIGSIITLADGTQKAVEDLTGNETLLVWNLMTGSFDSAPILFIDSDPAAMYSVINLYFSDGTKVKVISEHGFWDYNLNEYVYLDKDAAQYIGHWFNKLSTDENGNSISEKVQLVNVMIKDEYTIAYSPVTYGHLCYYVNSMLSMPGGIEGLFNIFEVDAETMKYDEAQMQADIAQYGLFTYEEFAESFPVSEDVFEAFNGQYLKVAMGKGLIDVDCLQTLIERYAEFLSVIE